MFNKARLKLTAWYLLIIMLVSLSFSMVIYAAVTREVDRFARIQRFRFDRRAHGIEFFAPTIPEPLPPITPADSDLVQEAKQRTILILAIINGTILIVSGGLGYFLAGKTLQPIKEMLDEQNRFISDASHELRTPLTALKTTMEVTLRDKKLSLTDAKTLMYDSIDEVNKLQALSDELLQLTQYQQIDGKMVFEILSLKEVAKQAIRKITPMANQKQIAIQNEINQYQIEGDKKSLTDLLVILLDNAVKYSPMKTTVTLNTKQRDGFILLSVKDEGIGIKENDLPYIFDRFYRADIARSKNQADGYGLGLSIAKKIIEIHQGTITVVSKLEKGSTFTIRLPLKQSTASMHPTIFS